MHGTQVDLFEEKDVGLVVRCLVSACFNSCVVLMRTCVFFFVGFHARQGKAGLSALFSIEPALA